MNNTMYSQNVYFPDVFKGCKNDCVYCKPSFQRQAKRQKQKCLKCYTFEPHAHLERLKHSAPKTIGDQFVFFPKGGDLSFCDAISLLEMINYARDNPQTTFLIQTKNPDWMANYRFPDNVILDITLETDRHIFQTLSDYHAYDQISKAMLPIQRATIFSDIPHSRKGVTVEPILQHSPKLVDLILDIKPEFVYVGYDTKGCKLPEPTLKETLNFINELSNRKIEVRIKTLRKAWYESTESGSKSK